MSCGFYLYFFINVYGDRGIAGAVVEGIDDDSVFSVIDGRQIFQQGIPFFIAVVSSIRLGLSSIRRLEFNNDATAFNNK